MLGSRKTYVMIDMSSFTPELIGGDTHVNLRLTMLPYCWHFAATRNSEWAITVTVTHTQAGHSHFHIALAQADNAVMSMAHGGGPSRVAAIELSNHLNDIISQFVK